MMFKTPILFLIFNRPEQTKIVFERIKQIKPKYLYIAADGPRKEKENEDLTCKKTRELVLKAVDWDCEIKTLFRTENLGCGRAVSEAINWFFENEEMGIILEDDCLPDKTFFYYSEELLEKYMNSPNIFSINGHNFGYQNNQNSYTFTRFMNSWGWATWRRSAVLIDYEIKEWGQIRDKYKFFKKLLAYNSKRPHDNWINNWINNFDAVYQGELDTWDYQWIYTQLLYNKLTIIPSVNLIENIGFSDTATHTTNLNHPAAYSKCNSMSLPLIEPKSVKNNKAYEEHYVKIIHYLMPKELSVLSKIKIRLGKILKTS